MFEIYSLWEVIKNCHTDPRNPSKQKRMKAPRKRITFKTPRKGTKTPTKGVKMAEANDIKPLEEGIETEGHGLLPVNLVVRYKQILAEMKIKEESLVDSYRKENEYLRSLKTDALVYKRFMGFDIVENNGAYEITHEIASSDMIKSIKFVLTPEDGSYIYKLVEARNVDLPDFLSEEIVFDEGQVRTFFFKVMEATITKKG